MSNFFTPLPSLPSRSRKNRPLVPCACGCGRPTHGTWYPGDDGRATGWAIRIERGLMVLADVPDNQRPGAAIMVSRREKEARAKRTA